jgi:hypothetical protein
VIITLTGTSPLIMHNSRLADPDDFYVKEIRKLINKKTDQTEDDRLEKYRLQFAGGLYHDEEIGPYLPLPNLIRSLRNAANLVFKNRGGKQIERGFAPVSQRAPLEYVGPRDLDGLWGNGDPNTNRFVDRRIAKVGSGKMPVCRPIFPQWAASFEFELDGNEIDDAAFHAYATKAGKAEGVGDARRLGYGRYTVEIA